MHIIFLFANVLKKIYIITKKIFCVFIILIINTIKFIMMMEVTVIVVGLIEMLVVILMEFEVV